MSKQVLIKPIISEKSEILSDKLNKYSFIVNRNANKIEIRKAVEEMYPGVSVKSVNTINMPAKFKNRNTKSGVIKGSVAAFKKAVVSLEDGDVIDFFGEV